MSELKTIFFIPDYILTSTHLDKHKFLSAISKLLNTKFESIYDFEDALNTTELNTISKRDLLLIVCANHQFLFKLKTFTIEDSNLNNKLMILINKLYAIYLFLKNGSDKSINKYFTEILSLYKGDIHNPEDFEDYLKTYEVLTDKNYICFIIKPGFSSCYNNIEKYGQYIASSLIRFDSSNQKDYINVLNMSLF